MKILSPNPIVRRIGIELLVHKCNQPEGFAQGSTVVRELIERATNASLDRQNTILEILDRVKNPQALRSDNQEVRDLHTVARLRSPDPAIRQREIAALTQEAAPGPLSSLTVRHRDFTVVTAVAEVLETIGTPNALNLLNQQIGFVGKFRQPNAAARQQAIDQLAANKTDGQARWLADLMMHYEDRLVIEGTVETLAKMGTPGAWARLVRINLNAYYEDAGPAMADAAGVQIAKLGAAGVELIAKNLASIKLDSFGVGEWHYYCAAATLRQVTDLAAIPGLRKLLNYNRPEIQAGARTALKTLGVDA